MKIEITDEMIDAARKGADAMTAPKCEDCRHQIDGGSGIAWCRTSGLVLCVAVRAPGGTCGPDGKDFQPKEGKRNE